MSETRIGKTAVDSRVPGDARALPAAMDFAVVGGGSRIGGGSVVEASGAGESVALFEAGQFGAGSSGYTEAWRWRKARPASWRAGDVLGGYQKFCRSWKWRAKCRCRVRTNGESGAT